ncbi:MAG: hypothetical protein CMD43_05845 [Gammaproteobacteria bacterium]|nr:hypothetical protein [Gammaproteobacteria bacterium]|tara:strand:+ start:495 stop:1424 length:930 start_codon:yes stop_codon:yes gene_type:complete
MSKNSFNILFLGGSKRLILGKKFYVEAKKKYAMVNLFSYELPGNHAFEKIGKIIYGKKWADKNILTHLQSIIKKNKINLIIPCVDESILIANKLNDIKNTMLSIISKSNINKIFADKILADKYVNSKGFRTIPQSKTSFPIYIKPAKGSAAKDNHYIKNHNDLSFFSKNNKSSKYIFQKYIKGNEYSIDIYVDRHGLFIGAIPRIRLNVVSGESIATRSIYSEKLISYAKSFCNAIPLIGALTLQVIIHKNNIYFLELNPRIGGGVGCAIKSGLNIPKYLINDVRNIPLKPINNLRECTMIKYYEEVFI